MFKRILIANRGEPAVRVIRTCHDNGIEAVVVYSEVDAQTLPVKLADRAVCIGPTEARDSYLNIPRILSAAEITGCEAVHPGYGFLAESSEFAEAVEAVNLAWIGPGAETMRQLSDHLVMRRTAQEAGVPVLPGSDNEITSAQDARQVADAVGYPVAIRSVVQIGGWKASAVRPALRPPVGFWVVRKPKDLETALRIALAETKALLNDGRVYLTRYLDPCRHLECQFVAAGGQGAEAGGAIVSDRECTIQHRHEKVLAEAPGPGLSDALRSQLLEWTRRIVEARQVAGAGTLEFIADASGTYFLGARSSLQPQHPVTEALLGCDLVAEQLKGFGTRDAGVVTGDAGRGAATSPRSGIGGSVPQLPAATQAPRHVIQCQVNAEDMERDFMPTSGIVKAVRFPGGPGIRVDTHVYAGYEGSAQYDTLLAKICVWDETRDKAIARLEGALGETAVEGVKTTLEFQLKILRLGAFRKGELSTNLVDREILGLRAPE